MRNSALTVLLVLMPATASAQAGVGTWSEPFRIDELPWAHADDTTTGVEMADEYDCGFGLDESGPEVVYTFELDRAARITAWVEGDIDAVVDVDVHLLDRGVVTDGLASCLDRGHRVAEAHVGPGTVWIVVDTFVEGGVPLAGSYVLRVDEALETTPGVRVVERELAQGVLWRQEVHDDLFGGAQTVNLVEVDLTDPDVIVEPRLGDGCTRTSDLAAGEGAVAAVNAGFFGPGCVPVGLVRIDDAFLASNPADRPPRAALGVGDDGLALVEHVPPGDPFDEVRHALGGLPQLVRGGVADATWREESAGESFATSRHPRTAACVTGDDYLIFLTFDGRTPAGLGVDLFDLADFLVSLGCDRGLNYDGGGSSVLWVTPSVGPGVASYPSDNLRADHLGERSVSNAWLVWGRPVNRAPRFTTTPPFEAVVGEAWRYDADVVDLDLDEVTFFVSEAPEGLEVDHDTGVLTWIPTEEQVGVRLVVLGAADDLDVSEQRFEVAVDPAGVTDGDGDGDGDGDVDADGDSDGDGDADGDAGESTPASGDGCGCCAAPGNASRLLRLLP